MIIATMKNVDIPVRRTLRFGLVVSMALFATSLASFSSANGNEENTAQKPRLQKSEGDQDSGKLVRDTRLAREQVVQDKPRQNGRSDDKKRKLAVELRAEKISRIRADIPKIKY